MLQAHVSKSNHGNERIPVPISFLKGEKAFFCDEEETQTCHDHLEHSRIRAYAQFPKDLIYREDALTMKGMSSTIHDILTVHLNETTTERSFTLRGNKEQIISLISERPTWQVTR